MVKFHDNTIYLEVYTPATITFTLLGKKWFFDLKILNSLNIFQVVGEGQWRWIDRNSTIFLIFNFKYFSSSRSFRGLQFINLKFKNAGLNFYFFSFQRNLSGIKKCPATYTWIFDFIMPPPNRLEAYMFLSCPSVCLSVRLSVHPSVHPWRLFSCNN